MKKKTFKAELLSGHKDAAVEVPFDPAQAWGIEAKPLWRGRRGHEVKGNLNGSLFESAIVPRAKKFWMVVDRDMQQAAKVTVGDVVNVSVEPV